MITLIQRIILASVAPNRRLYCPGRIWREGLLELARRGNGTRESGAFLLGKIETKRRIVHRFAYYDDFDPSCLNQGYVNFDGKGFAKLWQVCRESGLQVVADVHTHPGKAFQSESDRTNPMIATTGHVALIVPNFAQEPFNLAEMGVYEYQGSYIWHNFSGKKVTKYLYIGRWI